METLVLGGKFLLKWRIGSGSFGQICLAIDNESGAEVALKLEPSRTRSPQLQHESLIYRELEGGVGIPQFFWFGQEARFSILAMERLGESLEDLLVRMGHPFSLKTVLMIADQTIARIQFLHQRNFVHRDVKPDNFLMGLGTNQGIVYVIDFGLSCKYRDSVCGHHIPLTEHNSLIGTARYASISAMKWLAIARRDDLESLGYVFIYLLKGSLPWQGLPVKEEGAKMAKILAMKMSISSENLCEGLPREFVSYFQMVGKLRFHEEPDYGALRRLFRERLMRENMVYDYCYDWTSVLPRTEHKAMLALPPPPQPATQPVSRAVSPRMAMGLLRMGEGRGRRPDVRIPKLGRHPGTRGPSRRR
jgi:serine/threonine protein kinase